jgi:hypothetical protein
MQSRFEEQQPLGNSGFVHSDAQPQHVGKRLKGAPSCTAHPRDSEAEARSSQSGNPGDTSSQPKGAHGSRPSRT